jgi:RHS repeat-associated protein
VLHYPSGAAVTYTPDAAGRTLSAVDTVNSINYITGATYGPGNSVTSFVSGNTAAFAGITNTFSYNNRLQPCRLSATTGAVPASCFDGTNIGNVIDLSYDFHSGNGDNGNVFRLINNKDLSRIQTFTYDALNRLTSAQNNGTDCSIKLPDGHTKFWGNTYNYDAWGNLVEKAPSKCAAENLSVAALPNNQLAGYTYDAAGNMAHDATSGNNYTYDAENRITGAAGYSYTYDADGNRVEKSNGSAGTIYWYMSPGIVAESDLSGNLQSEYVFFHGKRVARKDFSGTTPSVSYYFSDHLGTASVITNSVGTITEDEDYYPFGGELRIVNNDPNHYKFTGKERDQETGLDYFGARYYGNTMGRFITPDPLMASGHVSDPQSWNRYAYALNNPLRYIDPTGMEVADSCAKDGKCQITVKVNVVWDKTANNGKGLTDKQKSDFKKNQIDKAVKDYAKSGIKLDVKYTEGSFTVDSDNKMHFTGIDKDSVNVVASNQTLDGDNESFMTKSGTSITLLNVNSVHDNDAFPLFTNTTEHELAHQFLGDTQHPPSNYGSYVANEYNVDARVQGQHMGISQTGFRTGVETRSYANPTNPEANKPQQK